jgi:hypothetical protein
MHVTLPALSRRRSLVAAAASGALIVTVLAPIPSALAATASATTAITLTATKTVGVPTSVPPGYHTFVLKESAALLKKDPRGLSVIQLAKGYSTAQLEKDLAAISGNKYTAADKVAYKRLLKNAKSLGGVELESDFSVTGAQFTVLLAAGTYLLDNGPSENGVKDNYTVLTVTGTAVGAKPATVGTITSKEFAYKLTGVKKGKHLYALHDAGAQLHMYVIFRLDAGHTEKELFAALESSDAAQPAWVHNGGFAGLLSAGQTMYTTLNFTKGNSYEILCFMPDVKTGAPHFALGMHRFFSIK